MQNQFGLIGYPLGHSFSRRYFNEKFEQLGLADSYKYELYPLASIADFPLLLDQHPNMRGLNVTIPYKQAVIPYLDNLSDAAAAIGAVNTIKISDDQLIGYNTDAIAFGETLDEFLNREQVHTEGLSALILGTGGAALAVAWCLKERGIAYQYVSRKPKAGQLTYDDLENKSMEQFRLIVNTTPLGMQPNIETLADIPYGALSKNNLLYDLVYNPEETAFLQTGRQQACATQNGLPMLHAQAEHAWDIWQSNDV